VKTNNQRQILSVFG